MTFNSERSLLIVAAIALAACAPPAGSEPAKSANSESTTRAASDTPTVDTFLAMEKHATDAYIKGDGAHFERMLSDKLVMQTGGSRLGKTDVLEMIAGVECEVQDDWALTEPQMSKIDDDTYAFTYKSTMDGTCTEDGKTRKLEGSDRKSSIWIRSGKEWQVVFHGEIPIFDPAAAPATDKKDESEVVDKMTTMTTAAEAPAKPTSDPISDALIAAERALWDAWMKHDADEIDDLTNDEIAFVNLFGTYLPNKAAAVADWTSEACVVTSFMLNNGVGSSISPTVGILTVTGTARGACGEQDISGQKIYGTTVYVKDGDAWKWAFGFNSPK